MDKVSSGTVREPGEMEPWVTTADVAGFLAKPCSWVYDNAGPLGIPRYKVGGQYRYRLSQVAEWVETQSVGPALVDQ